MMNKNTVHTQEAGSATDNSVLGTTGTEATTSSGVGADAGTATATAGTAGSGPEVGKESGKLFTQEELDRIISARIREEKDRREREAEAKRLEEQGEYRALLEKERAESAALQAKLKQVELDRMREKVAAKHKLPEPLAERLKGESEEELEKDAKSILQSLAQAGIQLASTQPGAPNPPSPSAGKGANSSRTVPSWGDIFRTER